MGLLTDHQWASSNLSPIWVGSKSGGAWIDLQKFTSSSIVYSFGIACEMSFDREIIRQTNCTVYGFDPDPQSQDWLETGSTYVPENFLFTQLGLFTETVQRPMYITDPNLLLGGVDPALGDKKITADFMTLQDIMAQNNHDYVDAIKMDINGCEYEILANWLDQSYSPPVGQIWVEFRSQFSNHNIKSTEAFVRNLSHIGLHPAKRSYGINPNYYLLVNRNYI